ncbi:MAG: hypothetical protein C4521_11215 [Actinobacteria bacterium]|nr:MAG: hypothetical protein C4521_11215 [Actinomycetota bacterium]
MHRLSSTRLAVFLVAALVLLVLLGALMPRFGVFSSIPFSIVLLALTLNLLACTVSRLLEGWREQGRRPPVVLWGSVVLHTGLLFILAGGLLTAAFHLDGTVAMTVGQSVDLSKESGFLRLQRGLLSAPGSLPPLTMKLESFEPRFTRGSPVAFDSIVLLGLGRGRVRRRVEVNRPAGAQGYAITQAEYGYSPRIALELDGRPLGDAFVALRSRRAPSGPVYEDFVTAPGLEDRLILRVFPSEGKASGGTEAGFLTARLESGGGRTQRRIEMGGSARVGRLTVRFVELRYWSAYRIRSDAGLPVVYAGFIVCLLGAILRYLPLHGGLLRLSCCGGGAVSRERAEAAAEEMTG